ncbi:hypothetical protein [Acrocarpospora sp. B8E8]|uniref:hypothetical protein n=1 Tax=Acrocarpospora sp. B8E8 TaxID=3153572 RepID=UPI00325D6626
MPHKDPEARKAYLREYKQRNRDRLLALQREQHRQQHPPQDSDAWTVGHSDLRYCRTCGEKADNKPPPECTESRHVARWETKSQRNNEYRRERRAEARARGEVYKAGRGDLARKALRQRGKHEELKTQLLAKAGTTQCESCGFADRRALQFDHRNGGGRKHRRSIGSGSKYYRVLLAMPADEFRQMFQVLCANCNTIKREVNEEWRLRHAAANPEEADEGLSPP